MRKKLEKTEKNTVAIKPKRKITSKTPLKTPLKILEILTKKHDMTTLELAKKINKPESAIKRSIRKFKRENRLKRIGPDKGGHWQVTKKQK